MNLKKGQLISYPNYEGNIRYGVVTSKTTSVVYATFRDTKEEAINAYKNILVGNRAKQTNISLNRFRIEKLKVLGFIGECKHSRSVSHAV